MLLEAKKLCKTYQRGSRAFPVLHDVDLAVGEGEFVVLRGRSGCGKSTLLQILLGLVPATSGEVLVGGRSLTGLSDAEASELRSREIGYCPQATAVLPTLTVLDNVRLPWYLGGRRDPEDPGRAQSLLEGLGIGDLASCWPSTLSGGELKRLCLARALMAGPRLVIADEPTAGLDAESAVRVVELLRGLCDKGLAVLMVSHGQEGLSLASRLLHMENGVLQEESKEK